MSDSSRDQKPKTQAATSGGPPKPPKKTARGLEDDSSDDPKKRFAEVLAKSMQLLEKVRKEQRKGDDTV